MTQKNADRRASGTPREVPPPEPRKPPTPKPTVANIDTDDPVDQASADSFPASDPPSFSGSRAAPADGKRK